MGHGGKREGSGRPKGAKTRPTLQDLQNKIAMVEPHTLKARNDLTARKLHDKAAADPSVRLPLDFLLEIMADERLPIAMRLDATKSAAPYLHSKLQTLDVKSQEDKTLRIEFVDFRETPALARGEAIIDSTAAITAITTAK